MSKLSFLKHRVRKQTFEIEFETINGTEYFMVKCNNKVIPPDNIKLVKLTKHRVDVYYQDIYITSKAI